MSALSGAACSGQWWLFDSTEPADHHEAKTICMGCPVRRECLELLKQVQRDTSGTARAGGGPAGTWAGHLVGAPKPRGKRKPGPREHGTARGYFQHKNNGERACAKCLEGYRFSEWMKKRYGVAV